MLIHPTAITGSKDGRLGEGSIITAGSNITVNTRIGGHDIINLACTIGHYAIIEDYCFLKPAVNVSGSVENEEGVFIGTGANVINNLKIGVGTVVGAGAVVTKSLPANSTAVGVPAKPINFREGKE